jgi:hypothetical protein
MKELKDAEVAESVPMDTSAVLYTPVEWSTYSLCGNAAGDSHDITDCSYKSFALTYIGDHGLEGNTTINTESEVSCTLTPCSSFITILSAAAEPVHKPISNFT